MAVTRRDPDALFSARTKKPIPFGFVLDELAQLEPWTRPMFGCTAVYVEERIVFVLRDGKKDADDGVWVATTKDHHGSLRRELPNLRSITVLGVGETAWQVLPLGAADFEESVLRACALVRAGDPRIGKVPKAKKAKKPAPADHKAEVRRRVAQKRGRRSRP